MADNSDLDRLIHAHLEGDLDEAGANELGRRIIADPDVARRVLGQAFVADQLPEAFAALTSTTAQLRQRRTPARRWPVRLAMAASLLIAIGALVLMWGSTNAVAGGVVVALDGTAQISDAHGTAPATIGSRVPADSRLLLDEGTRADVRLEDGSTLALSDGAAVGVGEHPGEVRLEHGRCVAEVAPQYGRRFLIATPTGEISVIGTRFMVAASAQSTEVSVDHGRVAVDLAGQRIELAPGQWTLASADRSLRVQGTGDSNLERGLLGWWPCDEGNREDVRDHSPWGRHGHIVAQSEGAWSDGGDGAPGLAFGARGFRPDGVRLPLLTAGSLPGLTVTMRLKWESGASPALLGDGPARVAIDADGHPLVEHRGIRLIAERALPANHWHHLAWRWNRDGRWDIFVDGQAVAGRHESAWTTEEWPSWPLALGHPIAPRIGDFAVVMNQVRLYGRTLSDAEVVSLAGR